MHVSAIENVQDCLDLIGTALQRTPRVLSPGLATADAAPPGDHDAYDVAVSLHLPSEAELGALLDECSAEGFVALVVPSWGEHGVITASCRALADAAGAHVLYVRVDDRGPQHDVTCIVGKRPTPVPQRPVRAQVPVRAAPRSLDGGVETRRGGRPYLQFLSDAHDLLAPSSYLEIGVHRGASLRLAACPTVAVDPDPRVRAGAPHVTLYSEGSDDFFRYDGTEALPQGVDLAFVDGLHLFEQVLRDVMHIERLCGPGSVVVVDDVLPNNSVMAQRERVSAAWTGDVWKLQHCLREHRPDLTLTLLDTDPTGLLLITGLSPDSRVLWDRYNSIVEQYLSMDEAPPVDVLDRHGAVDSDSDIVRDLLLAARGLRR